MTPLAFNDEKGIKVHPVLIAEWFFKDNWLVTAFR